MPFDFENINDYCSQNSEPNRAIFEICDCVDDGVFENVVLGDVLDISMEILVDRGSGLESGDNGVYWAENVNSTGGIPMQTYSSTVDACSDTDTTPDFMFSGQFQYLLALGSQGDVYLGTSCAIPDSNRVVKIMPVNGQQGSHGYTVTEDDVINNRCSWRIDIPNIRVDSNMTVGGEKVYVNICLSREDVWCCYVIYIGELCCPPSLEESLDQYDLVWTTGGHNNWFGQIEESQYDGDAAQSGPIDHNSETWIQTIFFGNMTSGTLSYAASETLKYNLSFYWKVSSELDYDNLEFWLNDQLKTQISGEVDWERQSFVVSPSDTLKWSYEKNGSSTDHLDTAWLDHVMFGILGDIYRPTPDQKEINLADAIVALQILAGIDRSGIYLEGDVNGDGKISLVEAIYILEIIAGTR
ncbi:MAG: hypothetical protein PF482_04750 [Desulfobacteraceae bacterium]|nr:hypothetical protein [Desulfobacteraceae bacterium]